MSSRAITQSRGSQGSIRSGSAGVFIHVRGAVTEAAALRTSNSSASGRT
ncbi:hypothetical protein [Streptomyces sp. NPDC015350]